MMKPAKAPKRAGPRSFSTATARPASACAYQAAERAAQAAGAGYVGQPNAVTSELSL